MADDNQDLIPPALRRGLGWCQFCGSAVQEVKFEPLGDGFFRYTNDCICLQHAVLVVEADGCYYWETISHAPRLEADQARDIWEKWQRRDLRTLNADAQHWPEAAEMGEDKTEAPEAFDAHLYEEAQIILSMYG